jgi:competence protein ComGF
MSNKNPFEIRSEVLVLAKEYMDKQVAMNIELAEKMLEIGKITSDDYVKAFKPYTYEEMMEKAKEFYAYISTKN